MKIKYYLHTCILAAAPELNSRTRIKSKAICIAYETVTDENNRLPLLAPMSAVAGRMSIQAGAHSLEKTQKGRGVLLGGAPGVATWQCSYFRWRRCWRKRSHYCYWNASSCYYY